VNLYDAELQHDDDDPPGYGAGYVRVGPAIGAELLGMSVYELVPGDAVCPYHWETQEEWLLVLAGRPTVRVPEGEHELRPGDVTCFPAGPDGAHKVTNRTAETVRVAILSTKESPAVAGYPDSAKVGAIPPRKFFREADAVDYFEGELPASNG
jgi:uncharacterized cupin superfamily protein